MKGSGDQEPSLQRLMAGYFLQLVDPERDGSYTGNSVRAFSELPYHLVRTVDRGIDKMIDLLIFLLFYSSFTKWFFWKLICNNFSRLLINDFVLFTVGLTFEDENIILCTVQDHEFIEEDSVIQCTFICISSAMFSFLQAYGGDFKTLSQVVCSLEFISNKCRLGLGNVLLEDYQEKGESETF